KVPTLCMTTKLVIELGELPANFVDAWIAQAAQEIGRIRNDERVPLRRPMWVQRLKQRAAQCAGVDVGSDWYNKALGGRLGRRLRQSSEGRESVVRHEVFRSMRRTSKYS